jgi:nitrogen fixation protein FixH
MSKRMDSGKFWAFVPVGLLGGLVVMVLGFVHIALTDPGFAVQDRYYSRALSWDERLAAERRSASLGWNAELSAVRVPGGVMDVTVKLADRDGQPVGGARVDVTTFAVARSRKVVRATFTKVADGVYRARVPAERGGLWDFSVEADRGTDRFTYAARRDVVEGPAS